MSEKRLFWLQLKNTYFNQLSQKKMRKQSRGLEMQVIYLRMMLLSLDNKGYIFYQGVYNSIEEELSEEFNEPLELVKQTIDFLIENKMVTTDQEDDSLFIPEALKCTGSESASAKRVREYRERKALQCNGNVTESNGDVTKCNSKDKNKIREKKELDNTLFSSLNLKEGDAHPPSADAGGVPPFTLIDCQECADEGKVNLSENGIVAFYNRMEKDNWEINGSPVENLLKAMRGFAKNHKRYQKEGQQIRSMEDDNKGDWGNTLEDAKKFIMYMLEKYGRLNPFELNRLAMTNDIDDDNIINARAALKKDGYIRITSEEKADGEKQFYISLKN